MRRALLTVALLLALPGTATAAPFGELPFLRATEETTCLQATGAPGELVQLVPTADSEGVEIQTLRAGPAGLARGSNLPGAFGRFGCPQVVARPGGAGLATYFDEATTGEQVPAIRAQLREPGRPWGASQEVLRAERLGAWAPGVSERGDVLVAAVDEVRENVVSIVATRRGPGGPFTGVEQLFERNGHARDTVIQAGMTAGGEAVVAWTFRTGKGAPFELWAAIAAPGLPFRPAARIASVTRAVSFALAVGAGGHALLAFPSRGQMLVAERAPGEGFGAPAAVAPATDLLAVLPAAAVTPDGGAIVGWHGAIDEVTGAVVRERPGPFGAPVALSPRFYGGPAREFLGLFFRGTDADELGGGTPAPAAIITPDRRALLTWTGASTRDHVGQAHRNRRPCRSAAALPRRGSTARWCARRRRRCPWCWRTAPPAWPGRARRPS